MTPTFSVLLPTGALLVGVLLQLLVAKNATARAKGWLAFACSLVSLAGVLALWPATMQGGAVDVSLLKWDGPITLAYHVDGLSQLFALMGAGIGAAVLLYSVDYMAHDPSATRFYVLMQIFIAGLIHLVYSADLFLIYLSWEIIGLCSFLLVGFWYWQKDSARGARKVLVMTHAAGYGLLAAVVIIYSRTGSTLWTDPKVAASFNTGIFLLILVAAVAKSVQFPLHTWIPDAMAAPTPVSALLHAACYVKAGVYLIARLHSLGPWPVEWQTLVTWIGAATLLIGVLFAMIQSDMKRLLAFHTVSQIGYMLLGLGLGTPLGIAAGLLHCLNHGLFKGGLFLCAGAVQHATGTRDMNLLGGLSRRMPKTTAMWLVVAGGIAGVPLLNGFVSKWLVYNAALEAGQPIPALIAWLGSILTAFSFLKATSGAFLGDERPDSSQAHEAPPAMLAGIGVLAAGTALLGVAPQLAVEYVINPVLFSLGEVSTIQISWMGLAVGGGSWFATGGLIMALVALAAGVLIFRMAQPAAIMVVASSSGIAGSGGTFTGGEPLVGPGRLSAGDFSAIIKEDLSAFYHLADPDRYYSVVWQRLLQLSEWAGGISRWLEARAIPAMIVLSVLVAGIAAALAPAAAAPADHATFHAAGWLVLAAGLAHLALVAAAAAMPATRRAAPIMVGIGFLAVMGLDTNQPPMRITLLEVAAFGAMGLVWWTAGASRAKNVYGAAVVLSAVLIVGGSLAMDSVAPALVLALLFAGFTLKLGAVPLYLWLPVVAESVPAPVIGLVVAVVDVAAFGELMALRASSPWLFAATQLWLGMAAFSALAGALLMLAQRDLKRMLVFSTVEDMGFLLLGVTLGSEIGLAGAALGLAAHSLGKALLFSSLVAPETEGAATLDSRGLASRYPVSGAAFLLGALAVLGVPPTIGYLGHWRLYEAAAQASYGLLALLVISTILALLAYARAVATCWWGSGEKPKAGNEPDLLRATLVALGLVVLAIGLWPVALLSL